ncbi:MAG: bifunctional phosphopantothenoylcysteine decarboxylase/phosphopantothenate--cysteine ligase CoaBC [Acidimicrobiales bacterium]
MSPSPDDPRRAGANRAALEGAVVVLGVTAGIAAYKAVEICRQLVDAGAHVIPVLTPAATRFVGTATFSALASEPARTELFEPHDPIPHTHLARRADLVLVAPATANFLAECAAGLARDLLGATLLATTAPVVVCPAMHAEMWRHASVQENLATLVRRGVTVVPPESGRLAGGDEGPGRLADPAAVVAAAAEILARRAELAGVQVLVTAGGTREPIDPVRYLGNRSSGRQGYALAEEARRRGATVTLVSASHLPAPRDVEFVPVETADELARAVFARAAAADVVVMAAAVADFRPKVASPTKLRKGDGPPEIVLEPTEDVLAELGRRRRPGQVLVGFAAETGDAVGRGTAKLAGKGVDLLVVNDVSAPGAGFGYETNAVTILDAAGGRVDVPLGPKPTIAAAVLDAVVRRRTES